MNRPVITGMGIVCALGAGVEQVWTRLLAGESGLRPLERFDAGGLRNELAGEVPAEVWRAAAESPLGGYVGLALQAYGEALRHARLADGVPADLGLVFATNFGGQDAWFAADDPGGVARLAFDLPARLAGLHRGPVVTLSNACSSGTNALGHAADLVRLGRAEVVVALGADTLGMYCLSGLSILHTITTDTLRPFDANRSGTLFGEGAGALVVESEAHARARGAEPLAEVLGYGVNNNAYHMTAPDKGGEGMVHAIRMALAQAGAEPGRVAHVNAHATGTEYHDPAEAEAIRTVLGQQADHAPVSAIKAATGHAMGAAGAIEAIATVLALRERLAPPTLNCDQLDPSIDVPIARGAPEPLDGDLALSVSAGLGGNNSAILLGRVA